MNIKFEDYLNENEVKEIVTDVFRQQLADKFKKDYERIFSNAAFNIVTKLVDEQMNGKMAELIAENTVKVINGLSDYTVFKRPDAWDNSSSEAYKILQKSVVDSKPLIDEKIKGMIDKLVIRELQEQLNESILELLDKKLFGAKI